MPARSLALSTLTRTCGDGPGWSPPDVLEDGDGPAEEEEEEEGAGPPGLLATPSSFCSSCDFLE